MLSKHLSKIPPQGGPMKTPPLTPESRLWGPAEPKATKMTPKGVKMTPNSQLWSWCITCSASEVGLSRSQTSDGVLGEFLWTPCTLIFRWADAMTKRNGNIPLLHILQKTGKICITEESATLAKHKVDPKSRNSSLKTKVDPAT